jgi:hypothetical protein
MSGSLFWDARVVIAVKEIPAFDRAYEVDVLVDGEDAGGGTAPTVAGAIDVAMNVLFGDTNDHLNGDNGALERAGLR